jgi:hypothetical protein
MARNLAALEPEPLTSPDGNLEPIISIVLNPLRQRCPNSQKCRSHLKIIGTTMVSQTKFHSEGPQTLGTAIQHLVTTANWRQSFEHLALRATWLASDLQQTPM